ncbi:hypothetical protein WEIDD23_00131 [Weissella sp. DD23]|nr:hypothetical protein WEIDD23_00131 [Weissella sp. DD23]
MYVTNQTSITEFRIFWWDFVTMPGYFRENNVTGFSQA